MMSEYQYYEWQTIDRPLTSPERVAVDQLSSHITVSATGAWVDYSWGDFKHEPLDVLADYFDAFLYAANWGEQRLAFRFPAELLDAESMQPYLVEHYISLHAVGNYQILSFELSEEEPPDEWIEFEGWLGSLAPLRNDILHGDHRVLYLAWLRALELNGDADLDEDAAEPPVPPGLDGLTASLQAFVDWCGLSPREVKAAAKASAKVAKMPQVDFAAAIGQLSREECEAFLLRLVREEPHLSVALRRRLGEV